MPRAGQSWRLERGAEQKGRLADFACLSEAGSESRLKFERRALTTAAQIQWGNHDFFGRESCSDHRRFARNRRGGGETVRAGRRGCSVQLQQGEGRGVANRSGSAQT